MKTLEAVVKIAGMNKDAFLFHEADHNLFFAEVQILRHPNREIEASAGRMKFQAGDLPQEADGRIPALFHLLPVGFQKLPSSAKNRGQGLLDGRVARKKSIGEGFAALTRRLQPAIS